MTLTAGSIGIDYSFARPSLPEAVKSGARFVLRYSAGAASNPSHPSHSACAGKLITPGEFKDLIAAGLDVIANSEWTNIRITEGAAAGEEDAAADLALWKSCGLAEGSSIYVSWDDAPNQDQWPAVDAYLHSYEARLGGYYHTDCYAGTPYLKHALAKGIIRYGWRPNADSWSNDGLPYQPANHGLPNLGQAQAATPAAIWQNGNFWFGNNADENLILRVPCGSHLQQSGASAPERFYANGQVSLHDAANQHGLTVSRLLWLTAQHKPGGYGPLEAPYIDAGQWETAMPEGMAYWA